MTSPLSLKELEDRALTSAGTDGPVSAYCQHPDEEVTMKPDGTMWEGIDCYCSACGHEWHITHDEWRQLRGYIAPVSMPDPDEIQF